MTETHPWDNYCNCFGTLRPVVSSIMHRMLQVVTCTLYTKINESSPTTTSFKRRHTSNSSADQIRCQSLHSQLTDGQNAHNPTTTVNPHAIPAPATTTILRPFFLGPPGWAGARRELLDFMVQGKINTGRHTDNPAGRHSIRTNQCLPPSSPHFLQAGCRSCCPTNSVKALKTTSAFGLGRRR